MLIDLTKPIPKLFSKFKKFKYIPDRGSLSAEIKNGKQALEFVKIVSELFAGKEIKVNLTYKLLKGEGLELYDKNIYRSKNLINISNGIVKSVKNYIEEKGEIYHPENVLLLTFTSIRVWVNELKSELYSRISEDSTFKTSNDITYRETSVKNVFDAYYYNFYKRRFSNKDSIPSPRPPRYLRNIGFKCVGDVLKLPIIDQIKLFNKNCREGTIFEKPLKYIETEKICELSPKDFLNNVVLTYNETLKLITPISINNLSFKPRPMVRRKIEGQSGAVFIFYDMEWIWRQLHRALTGCENEDMIPEFDPTKPATTEKADFVSYCVVDGNELFKSSIDEYPFEENSGHFKGENCVKDFILMVRQIQNLHRGQSIYCISHNGSKIEHTFIVSTILASLSEAYENYELKLSHIDGTKINSFYWKGITFVDSLLTFPGSLADLTASINTRYFKKSVSKEDLLNENWLNPTPEMIEYAVLDSISLAEMWLRGTKKLNAIVNNTEIKNLNIAAFKTGSSLIKWHMTNSYEAKREDIEAYGKDPKHTIKSELGWDNKDMSGLRNIILNGAKTECFWLGLSKDFKKSKCLTRINENGEEEESTSFAIKIDRVSSYPTEMATQDMPGKVMKTFVAETIEDLDDILKDKSLIYLILSKPSLKREMKIPLLCIKRDGKLIFPNFMRGEVLVPMWDFEYHAIRDNIKNITNIEVLGYSRFSGYKAKIMEIVNAREDAKRRGDKAGSLVYKILANSCYGSLGLNPVREVAYLVKGKSVDRVLDKHAICTTMEGSHGFTWVITKEIKEVNSIVHQASFITSRARFALWKTGIDLVENEKCVLLMCDTDSFIFATFEDRLEYFKDKFKDRGLGSWKIEDWGDDWEIAGLKVYRMGEDVKYKGIRGTYDELVVAGKITNKVKMGVWHRNRGFIHSLISQMKKMSFKYTKGIPEPGGKGFITPFTL